MPDGRRVQRSTRLKVRKDAQKLADEWEELSRGRMAAKQAHRVIADIYKAAHGDELPNSTVRNFFEGWLKRRKGEVSPATLTAYTGASTRLLEWLGPRADRLLSELDKAQLVEFRNDQAKRVAARTANNQIKLLRAIFEDARRDGIIHESPAKDVPLLKTDSSNSRRPFTVDEIQKALSVASTEWRSLILFGLYTGQRLADLALLTWANIDTEAGEIVIQTRKTGRTVRIPISGPLANHIEELPASDDPRAFLHPKAAAIASRGAVAPLSRQFGELLAAAGLTASTTHQGKGIGRDARRGKSEISFHSLRHSATSMMKNAGISPAVVQDIIGHDSAEVSRMYTKIESGAKRKALESLPDVTAL
jgi:integrase